MSTVSRHSDIVQDNITPVTFTIERKPFVRSGKKPVQMPVPASWQAASAPIALRDLIEAATVVELEAAIHTALLAFVIRLRCLPCGSSRRYLTIVLKPSGKMRSSSRSSLRRVLGPFIMAVIK